MVEKTIPNRRALRGSGGFVFFEGKLTATKHNYKPAREDNVVVGGD
ncbi:MAG: hypothetical protein GTN49_01025 [candidate division Zixibacteria bacterium]|nr:hypothetical protein [candidate division Zixibacteria bacterium]